MHQKLLSKVNPFFDHFFTHLMLAFVAEVLHFSLLWVALQAEVFKEYIDYEVIWQCLLASKFSGTKFHFTGLNVVPSLNKGRVKHDSEQCTAIEGEI